MGKAVNFMLKTQLEDGCWGESYRSCIEKKYVPLEGGQSNLVQTEWAMMGLIHTQQRMGVEDEQLDRRRQTGKDLPLSRNISNWAQELRNLKKAAPGCFEIHQQPGSRRASLPCEMISIVDFNTPSIAEAPTSIEDVVIVFTRSPKLHKPSPPPMPPTSAKEVKFKS
ncbi:Prenyltransferase/squalene oxidase, partial [Cynara cardunculus var. scolymus]